VEVQENVKMMLKMSTQFENNSIPGLEAPGLVIEDVMKLERRAMEKKVAYIEHFLTMSEDEKKVRNDLRDGKRKKKKPESPEEDFEEEPVEAAPPTIQERLSSASSTPTIQDRLASARVPAQPLPPPRPVSFSASLASIPEPTDLASRVPSRLTTSVPSAVPDPAAASASSLGAGAVDEEPDVEAPPPA